MAWTTVKCNNCDEEYQVQMYGKYKDREYRVASWSGLCDDCKAAKAAAAAQKNTKAGLPTLRGSDKQIAWAEQIRAAMISNNDLPTKAKFVINNLKSATYYIDNRNAGLQSLVINVNNAIASHYDELAALPADERQSRAAEIISNL